MNDAVKMAKEALRPFAETFAEAFVDEDGWKSPMAKERIVDWFGPSDFRGAVQALAALEQDGEPVAGIGTEDGADYAELKRLYNFSDDDSAQFTRWNMLTAIRHGKRLGQEFDAGEGLIAKIRAEAKSYEDGPYDRGWNFAVERCAEIAEDHHPATQSDAGEAAAWLYDGPDGEHYVREHRDTSYNWMKKNGWSETPLYAHPPQSRGQAFDAGEVSALRIGWWNDMRRRGVSQENAILAINAALSEAREAGALANDSAPS